MVSNKRRGLVGVAITIGLGVALSAAALFTTSVMNKGPEKGNASETVDVACTAPDLQLAYTNYTEAYSRYQKALQKNSRYIDVFKAALEKAKHDLELAILANSMGISQMDLQNILKK